MPAPKRAVRRPMKLTGRRSKNVEVQGRDNIAATSEENFIRYFRDLRGGAYRANGRGMPLVEATERGIAKIMRRKAGR